MNLTDFTYVTVSIAAIAHAIDKVVLWVEALLPKAEAVTAVIAADLPKLEPILEKANTELAAVHVPAAPSEDLLK